MSIQPPDGIGTRVAARSIRVSLVGNAADGGLDPCVIQVSGDPDEVLVDGTPVPDRLRMVGAERAVLTTGSGDTHRVLLLPGDHSEAGRFIERREVVVDGWRVDLELEPEARASLRARARRGRADGRRSGPTELRAMIPGVVLAVSVVPGDTVIVGQRLVIVEAMKMQNEIRAPRDGRIGRIGVGQGARIEVGDLLLVMD
ncbi:MAG: acetyl-CoA carboxylase biotin carboxyl carrier protein subunit [Chloroflexi bacterium]|nr:acetyl-CoA carboxylase biotin carboxyl carrier protein subunit [Chloroflexota bacterium]